MTGWDTPSRPTWDQQDGPDDGTQAFSVPDASVGDDDPWAARAGRGWGASTQSGGPDFGAPGAGGPGFGGPDAGDAFSGPPPEFFKQEFDPRTPGASPGRSADMPSWDLPVRDGAGRGMNGAGAQVPAWDELQRQDAPRPDLTRQDFGRPDLAPPDLASPDFGGQGFGPQDPVGQDFPRREPGRAYYDAQQDYAAQPGYPAQPEQPIPASVREEQERSARMDPALQDFFAPTSLGPGYGPRPGQGPHGAPAPGRVDPWDDPAGFQSPGPPHGSAGPGSRGGSGSRKSSGGRANRTLTVSVVVVVVVGAAAGAYLLVHKSSDSSAANGVTPTVAASTSASTAPTTAGKAKADAGKAKATANSNVTGSAATDGYLLSTPSVAGGHPIGSDPGFLATATATATAIERSAVGGNGGTVTGKPVAASYTLADQQTIEFVGYQGTFNPKTVMTNLGSFGSSEATYNAGPHGGKLACANVPATATATSGGVCVWVTATTLGVAEFFEESGPEVLTVAQSKGAQDTVALRSSVETRKSR
jgi:hypothetical protein